MTFKTLKSLGVSSLDVTMPVAGSSVEGEVREGEGENMIEGKGDKKEQGRGWVVWGRRWEIWGEGGRGQGGGRKGEGKGGKGEEGREVKGDKVEEGKKSERRSTGSSSWVTELV